MEPISQLNNSATTKNDDVSKVITLFEDLKLNESGDQIFDDNTELKTMETDVEATEESMDLQYVKQSKLTTNTAQRYRALGKIIYFMRKRYLSGDAMVPLSLDEILEKTKQTKLAADVKRWLLKDSLPANKRIQIILNGEYFQFKPAFKLSNAHDLLKLLKERDRKGLGGIFLNDLRDSLPHYRQVLKECHSNILIVKRALDGKGIVYYVDEHTNHVSEFEVQAMWHSLGLEDIEEVYEPTEDDEFSC